jgi:hypothetical protein
MFTSQAIENPGVIEREWRRAVVEVEHARSRYMQYLKVNDLEDPRLGRAWLRLYRAERRRDELLLALE